MDPEGRHPPVVHVWRAHWCALIISKRGAHHKKHVVNSQAPNPRTSVDDDISKLIGLHTTPWVIGLPLSTTWRLPWPWPRSRSWIDASVKFDGEQW